MTDIHKIYKYEIEITGQSTICVPAGAKILSATEQYNGIVLYAMVPYPNDFPEISKEVTIRVIGTGNGFEFDVNGHVFLGTVSLHGGKLMFHVFYKDHGHWG